MRTRLVLFLLVIYSSSIWSKVYRNSISRKIRVSNRQWSGIQYDSAPNIGGWLVRITNADGGFACCGAYYSHLLVISSANCMSPFRWNPDGTTADGTAFTKDEVDNYAEIEFVYIPDEFVVGSTNMDIALIRLRQSIKGKMTEFIKLCDTAPDSGIFYNTFAWGYSSIVVQKPSSHPRTAIVPFQKTDDCQKMYKPGFISETVICVVHPKDRRDCLYDSGSPLVYKDELCGIASIGATCQNTSTPGVYTDIMKVKSYIEEIQLSLKKDVELWGKFA
ncbi:hypothetical protein KR044_010163, partial [Drosophila immigrans]